MASDDLPNPLPPASGGLRWTTLFAAVFLGVLAGIAAWFLLLRLFPVLVMAAAGFGLAYVFDPVLDRLEARGWSRGKAVGAVAVGFLVVLGVVLGVLVPLLVGQVQTVITKWPEYSAWFQDRFNVEQVGDLLSRYFPREQITPYLEEQAKTAQDWLAAQLPKALGYVSTAVLRSATVLGYVFITLLISLYAMMVIDPFRRRFAALFSAREAAALRTVDRKVTYMLGQYLRGMLLTCLGIGVTNAILLAVVSLAFGTSFSLLLGALAGVAYLVPYLGMLTAVVVTGLLAYVTSNGSWPAVVLSVGVILVVNQVYDSLVMPRIVGRKVGLHPLVIVLALLAGGSLLGIWGMILATPLAATIKIILAQWVPVVATVPDVPEEKQPLVLDLGGFMAHTWGAVRSARHKLEEHLTPHGREKEGEEPK
jgi:predicted PurR-regulated permease PerM